MKVLIIGGGITGLTTALGLTKLGISCKVFERAPQLTAVGAGIWMAPNALKVFEWLGIEQKVLNQGVALKRVELTNKNLIPIRQSKSEFISDKNFSIASIHRAKLQTILTEALPQGILNLGKEYISHEYVSDKVRVTFSGGHTEEADVVLAADGIHSKVRQNLFPESSLRYSGVTCWRGISEGDIDPQLKATCMEAWGKKIRFGFSTIGDNQIYWFAVKNSLPDQKDNLATLQDELLNYYKDFSPAVHKIIRQTPKEKLFRNDICDLKRLKTWHQGRICLLGDAAHATTPNMGQGGAQGVEDGYYISHLLAISKDPVSAFEQFEKLRRKKVDQIVNTSWLMGKMAHNPIAQPIVKFMMRLTPEKMLIKQMKELYYIKEF